MHHLFTPNHVQLLNACYPPSSALLAAGPDFAPNSHELSRLTYYASNNHSKLTKLGAELEKRLRTECRKASRGSPRMRASLLITLSIFRSLALECKHDLAFLSSSLIASVQTAISTLKSDLEIVARASSVFSVWTTYTDGHLIGADSALTSNYLSTLQIFASLSCDDISDTETRNRRRLTGLASLTAALNSEALYNDFVQFRAQVAIKLRPILLILLHSDIASLNEQMDFKDSVLSSPYLTDFRTRPASERRATSIHLHVDGHKGPTDQDVCEAALRALISLLNHANGPQLGFIMQSTFDNLDEIEGWVKTEHCCWIAQRLADWAQYQYRNVVPTWLVERLLENQNSTKTLPMHQALAAMITTVLSSPTRMINLSSSDILSNLITILIRRSTIDPDDPLIHPLENCISSLGTHVYYSDQIQDLAGELVARLVNIEIQGLFTQGKTVQLRSRSAAIKSIVTGLAGLMEAANKSDNTFNRVPSRSRSPTTMERPNRNNRDPAHENHSSRRTRVPPDIWQDTLSLICDRDNGVRQVYANALIYYLTYEMPKHGDCTDYDGIKRVRRLVEGPFAQAANANILLHAGDAVNKLLNALHAYLYILFTSSVLGLTTGMSLAPSSPTAVDISHPSAARGNETMTDHEDDNRRDSISPSQGTGRRSISLSQGPRDKKTSLIQKYVKRAPSQLSNSPAASLTDIQNAFQILRTVQEQVPVRGLLAGVPMLLSLQRAIRISGENPDLLRRKFTIDELIARVWLTIGTVWKVTELVKLSEQALKSMRVSFLYPKESLSEDTFLTMQDFSWNEGIPWTVPNGESALETIVCSETILEAFGVDKETLHRRLSAAWTPEAAVNGLERSSGYETTVRGDGVSPLLKISPALMHMNNMSLQSLARSTRGLGVTDLREALEGRSSMSNPNLVRPPSISTIDHGSSVISGENGLRLTPTRSRTHAKKRITSSGAAGEVRDVLSKLGIGKQNGNLLKASFATVQKAGQQKVGQR